MTSAHGHQYRQQSFFRTTLTRTIRLHFHMLPPASNHLLYKTQPLFKEKKDRFSTRDYKQLSKALICHRFSLVYIRQRDLR